MDRRHYLALVGSGLALSTAGCTGGDGDNGGDDSSNGGENGGENGGGNSDANSGDNGSDDAADDQSGSDDSSDDGSSSDGSAPSDDNGSTDGGSGDDGTSDGGSTDDGSGDDGTSDGGSTDDGSSDDGTSDGGSTDDGSSDDGTSDGGSTDDGSSDDDSDDDPPRSDAPELLNIRETLESDTPLFDADTVVLEGDGQSVTDPFTLDSGLAIIGFGFEGGGSVENYILELAGTREEIVVNALDPISGAAAVPAEGGEYQFDVDAPAAWTLQVGQPVAPAEEIRTVSAQASGEGRAVVGPLETLETTTASATYEGEGNFIVEAYLESATGLLDSEIVFNEIGSFEGETLMDITGILWFDIQAEGDWTLEIE